MLLGELGSTERSLSPPGGPGSGFRPSFKAFLMSAAFQIAYFCFCSICTRVRSSNCKPTWLSSCMREQINPKEKKIKQLRTHIRLQFTKLRQNLIKNTCSIEGFCSIPVKSTVQQLKNFPSVIKK